MPSENVYVVTCDQNSEHGELTEVLRVYKSLPSANQYALTYLEEEHGVEWDEYEEETSSNGTAYVCAVGGEGEEFEVRVIVKKLYL